MYTPEQNPVITVKIVTDYTARHRLKMSLKSCLYLVSKPMLENIDKPITKFWITQMETKITDSESIREEQNGRKIFCTSL